MNPSWIACFIVVIVHVSRSEAVPPRVAEKLAGHPDLWEEAKRIGALLRDSMQHARILSRGLAPWT